MATWDPKPATDSSLHTDCPATVEAGSQDSIIYLEFLIFSFPSAASSPSSLLVLLFGFFLTYFVYTLFIRGLFFVPLGYAIPCLPMIDFVYICIIVQLRGQPCSIIGGRGGWKLHRCRHKLEPDTSYTHESRHTAGINLEEFVLVIYRVWSIFPFLPPFSFSIVPPALSHSHIYLL